MTPSSANLEGQRAAPSPADGERLSTPNLLHRYLFWTYERGSFHYDVMVTLILLFLFIAPHVIDFHDRPIPEVPARSSEILVRTDGTQNGLSRFHYQIRAEDLKDVHSDTELRARITEKVTEIAPGAQVVAVKPVGDPLGHTIAYDATVLR